MENFFAFLGCFYLLPSLLIGGLGFLLGWFLKPSRKAVGDLTTEGEGALRAEADSLRARVQDLEGRVSTRDTEVSDLKTKLAAAAAGAAAGGAAMAAANSDTEKTSESDETYALEWQNRYLAARVKYLESRVAEETEARDAAAKAGAGKTAALAAGAGAATLAAAGATSKAKAKPKPKAKATAKPAAKTKAAAKPKPKAAAKPKAKAAAKPKPKVLYTDGPTDGEPDDLKRIKGIGPKFEKDLNAKGIYYYRQIGAWKRKDVEMVEGVIDSFPGRIDRDDWIAQAKQLAKGGTARTMKARATSGATKTRAVAKPKTTAVKATGSKKAASTRKPAKSDAEKRIDRYYENVRKYDASAKRDTVASIVKYCGVSLRSRDTSLVACSDEQELDRIVKGFAARKLGLKEGRKELVQDVCQQMKSQRQKSRVTFYYLMAKKAGKLDVFS